MKTVSLFLVAALGAAGAFAANFNANDTASLTTAINSANGAAGADTITITANIVLSADLPQISSDIAFIGGNFTISGNSTRRIFWVNSGTVSFSNMTLTAGRSRGGDGGDGANFTGGGGLGAGGAIFVNNAGVTCTNVTFTGNQAIGGNGGDTQTGGNDGGGGGGGMAGNGGNNSGMTGGAGGGPNGGSGGPIVTAGGAGGFGGGGGGGGGTPGINQGAGGNGGFGGGGGGTGTGGTPTTGGAGGFGGGGGGSNGTAGLGGGTVTGVTGRLGGDAIAGPGGGGAGLGGAIFINQGSLTITNCTFNTNSATGGSAGVTGLPGNPGKGVGGGLFVNNGVTFNASGVVFGGNTAGTQNPDVYPALPTAVSSIVRLTPAAADTNAASVTFRVNFSASVTGVNAGNFTLSTTGVSGASITGVSGSATQWSVTVNTGTGNGTIRLDMANSTSVVPGVTNTPFNTGETYTIDKTAPAVQSINRASPDPTAAASVQFTVTFTESVIGAVQANFSLAAGGAVSGAAITGVTGTGATRTVTVSTGTGDGTIRLDLLNLAPAISDAAGNNLTGAFISGQSYTIDRNPPTVSIGAPSAPSSTGGDISYTLTYTDAVSISLAPVDISLTVTGTANGTVAISGSGLITRTVTITSITGNGTIGFNVAAGTCLDGAGNLCLAAGPSATFNVLGLPQISIGAPSVPLTRGGPVDFVVTYTNAAAVTLAAGDVTVNGVGVTGNAAVTGSGVATRTVTVSGITGDGSFTIGLAAGTASNGSGAALAAGPSGSVNVDNTVPVFTPSPQISLATGQTQNAAVAGSASDTFSTASSLVLGTGTLPAGIAVSNLVNTAGMVVADFTVSSSATVGIALVPFTVTDEAGNVGTGNFEINVFANAAPTIDVIGDQTIAMNGTTAGLVLSIDDPDEGPNALVLSAASNNAILMDGASAYVFGGTGGSRTLAVTARPNNVGFARITVTVTDSLGGSATASFLLTVTDASDAPSLNSLVDVTILRDVPSAGFAFTAGDPQGTAGLGVPNAVTLHPAIVSNGGVNISGAAPNFSFVITPEPGQVGQAVLVFSISDGTHTFSQPITVTVVNPTPAGDDGDDGNNGCAQGRGIPPWLALLALALLPMRRPAPARRVSPAC